MSDSRTVDFTIKATDTSKQTIDQVVSAVKILTQTLEAQVQSSLKGATSAGEFRKALADVRDVSKQLTSQQLSIGDFDGKSVNVQTAIEKLRLLIAARDEFVNKAPVASDLTGPMITQLQRFETQINNADKAVNRTIESQRASSASLARMGVDTGKLAEVNRTLATALGQANDALNGARDADLAFVTNKNRAAEVSTRFAARLKEEGIAAREAADEIKKAAVQTAELARMQEMAQEVASRIAATKPAAADTAAAPPTFQQTIQDRLRTPTEIAATQSPLGDKATLLGNYGAVAQLNGELTSGTRAAGEYGKELRQLAEAEREVVRQAGIVTGFEQQRAALDAASVAFKQAQEEVRRLNAAIQAAPNPEAAEAMNRQLGPAKSDFNRADNDLQRAQQGYDRERQALVALGIEVDEVGAAQRRLTQTASLATQARIAEEDRERISLLNLAAQADTQAKAVRASLTAGTPLASVGQADSGTSAVRDALAKTADKGSILEADEALDKLEKHLRTGTVSAHTYADQMAEIYAIQRKIASDAGLIENFDRQAAAVKRAELAYANADAELKKVLADTAAGNATPRDINGATSNFNSSASALSKQIEDRDRLSAMLKRNGIDTSKLVEETQRLTVEAERLAGIEGRAGTLKQGGFQFNLGQIASFRHEIEATITQLSLGSSITQVMASHIGQTLYTFNVPIERMLGYVPIIGAVVGAFGTMAAALARVQAEINNLRTLDGVLASNVDGIHTTTGALYDAEKATQALGASFKEASESVIEFFKAGINPDRIKDFAKAAFDLSEVMGVKLPQASKELAIAFTGSYDEVKKLNEQYNFLSSSQQRSIREAFEEGRTIDGRNMAFAAFSKIMDEAAEKTRTNYTVAIRGLSAAWDDFLTVIGRSTGLSAILQQLKEILTLATAIIQLSSGEISARNFAATVLRLAQGKSAPGPNEQKLQGLESKREELSAGIQRAEKVPEGGFGRLSAERIAEMKAQLAELDVQIKALRGSAGLESAEAELAELKRRRDDLTRRGETLTTSERTAALTPSTSNPGVPASYTALRDQVADKVGLDREALARVQNVEGVYDPATGKWSHSQTGVTGPMQVTHKTFAEIRGNHPDVGENIDDPETNTLAGAYYLREQAQKSGGNLAGAYSRYNGVPKEYERANAAMHNGVNINSYSGQTITDPKSGLAAIDARIHVLEAQVDANKQAAGSGGTAAGPGDVTPADRQRTQTANEEYVRKSVLERGRERDRNARGPEALARDNRELDAYRREQNLEASKNDGNAGDPKVQAEIEERVDQRRKVLTEAREKRDQAERDRDLAAEHALANELMALHAKVDNQDKTDAAARRRAVDEEYAKYDQLFEKAKERKLTEIDGVPIDAFRGQVDAAKNQLKDQVTSEADTLAVTKIVEERKVASKRINDDLVSGAISITEAFKRAAALTAEFTPRIKEAVATANADLTKQGGATPSPAIRAAIAKNDAIRPDDPGENRLLTDKGFAQLEEYTKARADVRATEKALVADGLETTADAEAKIKAYYETTTETIRQRIVELRTQLELERQAGTVSPADYNRRDAQLKRASADTTYVPSFEKDLTKTFETSTENNAVRSVEEVGKAVGNLAGGIGKLSDVWQSVGKAAADFASGILKDVAAMIIKYEILAAVQSTLGQKDGGAAPGAATPSDSGGGGFWSFLAGGLKMGANSLSGGATGAADKAGAGGAFGGNAGAGSGGLFGGGGNSWGLMDSGPGGELAGTTPMAAPLHGGGIVGGNTMMRAIDPSAYMNAVRYHAGGMAGLSHDEVPTILQRGEEVITRNDARHVMNGGKAGGAGVTSAPNIRQVLVFDPKELSSAMSGSHGEDVTITHIRNNADKINSVLGR